MSAKFRYYYVTFDISPSKGRTAEYNRVRAAIKLLVGPKNYFPILMQGCVVRTKAHRAPSLRDSIKQQLGSGCNILVVKLDHGFAFSIKDRNKRQVASETLRRVRKSSSR